MALRGITHLDLEKTGAIFQYRFRKREYLEGITQSVVVNWNSGTSATLWPLRKNIAFVVPQCVSMSPSLRFLG